MANPPADTSAANARRIGVDSDVYRSGAYLAAHPDWHEADAPHKAEWIGAILARNGIAPRDVVDVGCGGGLILELLGRRFPHATLDGYDISPQAIALAAKRARPGLAFHNADLLATPPPARPADLLLAIDVFEHVDDYMGFLRGLRPYAARQVFHIPLDLSVQGLLRARPMMHARATIGHLHYFNRDTALATLADCGYQVIDWSYTHGAEELPRKTRGRRVLNVLRSVLRPLSEDLSVRVLGGASMLVLTR